MSRCANSHVRALRRLAAGTALAVLVAPGCVYPAGSTGPLGACDASLWNHVYNPDRLQVQRTCATVSGTVDRVLSEADGDIHIRLRLDAANATLINSANQQDQYGDLVVEVICANAVTQTDAQAACSGFTSHITVPAEGSHVRVLGAYVLDTDHGWEEIHPVTRIQSS
ncbi:MAG: hypothetical protein ACYDDF_07810 [Thermoplasmatota archaeon]